MNFALRSPLKSDQNVSTKEGGGLGAGDDTDEEGAELGCGDDTLSRPACPKTESSFVVLFSFSSAVSDCIDGGSRRAGGD